MKFLFIAQGYPPVGVTTVDSGIGKYLREMCLGLTAQGHECHVLTWGEHRRQTTDDRRQTEEKIPFEDREGVKVFHLGHAYWPIIERFMPESRDVWNLRRMVRMLDKIYHYDWIEIGNEEGLAVGVLQDYSEKCVVRIHTTLAVLVLEKKVQITRRVKYRLAREARSFRLARRVAVSSEFHAKCLMTQFPFLQHPMVIPLGYDDGVTSDGVTGDRVMSDRVTSDRVTSDGVTSDGVTGDGGRGNPSILVVGGADRRKGFDRIMPVVKAFVSEISPCKVTFVSRCTDEDRRQLGLCPPYPAGLSVEWREGLTRHELMEEYARASVLLQLSRYESFGWPVVEAASQGTPVVSTEVGTAPELLNGELNAYLVDGDDPKSCVRAISHAIHDRARIGTCLRQRYQDRYTRDRMAQVYLGALNKGL